MLWQANMHFFVHQTLPTNQATDTWITYVGNRPFLNSFKLLEFCGDRPTENTIRGRLSDREHFMSKLEIPVYAHNLSCLTSVMPNKIRTCLITKLPVMLWLSQAGEKITSKTCSSKFCLVTVLSCNRVNVYHFVVRHVIPHSLSTL